MKVTARASLWLVAISIALLFAGSLLWAIAGLRNGDDLLRHRIVESVGWASWQIPFELDRLRSALLSYTVEPVSKRHDDVILRLDIAASRVVLLKEGHLRESIEKFGLIDNADHLIRAFRTIDRDMLAALNEDPPRHSVLDVLSGALHDHVRDFQKFAALMQTSETQRISAIIEKQSQNAERLYVSLAGFLASGLLFALFMIVSNRRIERLGQASDAARDQALLSQGILEDAIEALPDAFALYDPEDRLVLCNENYRRFHATSADLIVSGARFEGILRAGVERGQYRDAEDNKEQWIAARLADHRNPKGVHDERLDDGRYLRAQELKTKAGYIVSVRTDISNIKQAQLAAQQSEKRFRLAAQATMDGLWEWIPETNEFWFSRAFRDIFELGDAQASLKAWMSRLKLESARATESSLMACTHGEDQRFEVDQAIERDGGEERHIECRGMRETGEDGKALRVVGAITDVTKQRLYEKKLLEAKTAAEHVADMRTRFMTMISHEIRTPINGIMGALEAMGDGEIAPDNQRYLTMAVESSQALRTLIDDVLDASKIDAGEFSLRMVVFSPVAMVMQVAGLLAVRAEQAGLDLAVYIDPSVPSLVISDEARLRQVLMNLVGNAIKFTKAGGIEIRLENSPGGDNKSYLNFSVIDTGIGIAIDQLDRLFKPFRQIDEGYRREFGGTGLGLSISQSIAQALGSEISCSSEPGHGSRFSLRVLCEQADGAVQAYPYDLFKGLTFAITSVPLMLSRIFREQIRKLGGSVVDTTDIEEKLDVAITNQAAQASTDENLPSAKMTIFLGKDHWQAPYELSELVQAVFPEIEDCRKTDRWADASEVAVQFSGKRILIVEDSRANRELAEHHTRRAGFTCVAVENGAQAVEAARDRPFDMILMDVSMPVMDGIEATRRIREFSDVPIVGVTAHAFATISEELSQVGMNAHLVKPYRREELLAVCKEMLSSGEQAFVGEPVMSMTFGCSNAADEIIDMSILRELESDIGLATLTDLLSAFLDEMDGRCARISAGLDEIDHKIVRHEAHALKSSARAFGAFKLSTLAKHLEMAAWNSDVASIRSEREPLQLLAASTRAQMSTVFPEITATPAMKTC